MDAKEKAKSRISFLLLTADWHWLTVPVGKQKGQILKGIGWVLEKTIEIWKWLTVHVWIPRMLKRIGQLGQIDHIIYGGDLIESEFNERGMVSEEDFQQVQRYVSKIRESAEGYPPMYLAPGDHELGYRLPMSKDPEGGISLKSIRRCMGIFGRPFEYFSVGQIHFILLSSSLLIQSFSHRPEDEQAKIAELAREQIGFLIVKLLTIPAVEEVFLFLHDPDALVKVDEIISDKTLPGHIRDKEILAFCGHLHGEWVLSAYRRLGLMASGKWARFMPEKIRNWAAGNLERLKTFERYKLRVIPAPGGMMGMGKGFLTLSVYDDGTWEIQRKKI
ncbi:MAG TPA: hypothetical protein VF390_02045 [Patescibacteria group bacterium]